MAQKTPYLGQPLIIMHEAGHLLHIFPGEDYELAFKNEVQADELSNKKCLSDSFRTACGQDTVRAFQAMRAFGAIYNNRPEHVHIVGPAVQSSPEDASVPGTYRDSSLELKKVKALVHASIIVSGGDPSSQAEIYKHFKIKYQSGEFDSFRIGKHFAYEYLEAAKNYASKFHGADLGDTFERPLVGIVDYSRLHQNPKTNFGLAGP